MGDVGSRCANDDLGRKWFSATVNRQMVCEDVGLRSGYGNGIRASRSDMAKGRDMGVMALSWRSDYYNSQITDLR